MRRYVILFTCIVVILLACTSWTCCAQTQSASPSVKSTISTQSNTAVLHWEYLVVSFGKAYFTDPLSSEAKIAGVSKVRAFTEAGVLMAQEAIDIQNRLDKLGKFGWELTGVVGAIGGDQEFILKRRYDPARSKAEIELVQTEGKRLKQEAAEIASQKAKDSTETLIDLDATEQAATDEANRSQLEKYLREFIATEKYPLVEMDVPIGKYPVVKIVIDGAQLLLKNGNKYRASEANSLAAALLSGAARAAGLTSDILKADISRGSVTINMIIHVNYQGKLHPVAYSNGNYYIPGK
ncbi:MAG: hypothetical protein ACYC27_03515 [Armatimonadota bacterium]